MPPRLPVGYHSRLNSGLLWAEEARARAPMAKPATAVRPMEPMKTARVFDMDCPGFSQVRVVGAEARWKSNSREVSRSLAFMVEIWADSAGSRASLMGTSARLLDGALTARQDRFMVIAVLAIPDKDWII